ncbi:unnamed protein product [Haemonchus placei]|uniref:Uncharacterized protein n=1 Tax=Haemonchus placei TaxID=6290 RepID=A0A3P7VIB7_HAEPC|nr:unnamed protein product [Haemonchus placei]
MGQFSLHPRQNGGWNMGMSQGANIFGFGGHRALGIAGNDGGIGLSGTDNAIVANERVGVDSGLSAGRNGLDLGSLLQFGNNPNPVHPGGQLGSFLDNIRNFFASLVPSPLPVPPPQPPALPPLGGGVGPGNTIYSASYKIVFLNPIITHCVRNQCCQTRLAVTNGSIKTGLVNR